VAELRSFEDSVKRRAMGEAGPAHPFHLHALIQLN
jgi:hypothetical protein